MKAEELRYTLAIKLSNEDLDKDGLFNIEQLISVYTGLVTVDESDEIRLVYYLT